jgi:hypothetical protein
MDRNIEQPPWARLAAGNPDCPSDLLLDRLHAGELGDAQAAPLRQHIAACPLCPERMASRQAGFAAVPGLDERVLLAGIRRRLDAEPAPLRQRLAGALRRLLLPLSLATGLAALAVVLLARPQSPTGGDTGPDQTREKGGLSLSVFRLVEGRAQQAISGDHFVSGDRLRFVVDLPSAGQVAVLGVEGQGSLYVAWPSAGTDAQRLAGKRQELPGAVALDSSTGRETLYLVLCPASGPAPATACQTSGSASAAPSCPRGCLLTPFVLNKN